MFIHRSIRSLGLACAASLPLAGCSERLAPVANRDFGFVDRIWQVKASTAGDPGQLYVFLSDGTLLIASSHGTPMIGSWLQEKDGALTMVEEGIAYHVDVLELTPRQMRLRSQNPREPVEMTLVPAGASALQVTPGPGAKPESPAEPERRYVPLSRVTETWGPLQLSRTRARIAAFAGEMKLEHAGVMAASAGSDLAGAEVFRILNAGEYFASNKGQNAFCAEPPRWLAIRQESGGARASGEIWVALLTLADWARYRPDVAGYCAGGLYAPEPSAG